MTRGLGGDPYLPPGTTDEDIERYWDSYDPPEPDEENYEHKNSAKDEPEDLEKVW
jgi:hypothetical protein